MNTSIKERITKTTFNSRSLILLSLFLVPGLLLWTPNFSVAVTLVLVIYSITFIVSKRKSIKLNRIDYIVLLCFSAYFLSNVHNLIRDFGNFRYIDAPSKILICFAIYLLLKDKIPNLQVRKPLELGIFIGSIGTISISLFQLIILNFDRVDGFLFSINFGYLSCSMAFMSLCMLRGSKNKTLLWISFFLLTLSTLMTLTRGAILAIPIILGVILILNINRANLKHVIFGVFAFLSLSLLAYHSSEKIQKRTAYTIHEIHALSSGDISSAVSSGGRLQLWYASLVALQKSPILGLPHEEREKLLTQLHEDGVLTEWVVGVSRGHAHSQYFEMIASTGSLSLLAILAMLVVPSIIFFKRRDNVFGYTGFIFIIGISIFGLTEVLLQANLISVYFGFFLAFFLAASIYGTADKPNVNRNLENNCRY
ncbi:O-antigen ligase family protein [Grimontia marina]|uniref:O-Antigen ligase n=1 Tax=Grimontia marina TaxID=646534 RepID=A0A128F1K9_9GAMM|nr:O-antigen ligase family protein [Grimontia marina]CZF80171.1 O-Antigen ligase [Grimontia marina]